MKIAHECPCDIFEQVQAVTDYDYCLVHLLEENERYRRKFIEAKNKNREIILDNSLFELEVPFDPENFARHILMLEPTWYIIPDKLEDMEYTVRSIELWNRDYKDIPGKKIGVVQGKTREEVIECYRRIEPLVDMVAISFDYSFFKTNDNRLTMYEQFMFGRVKLIMDMNNSNVINKQKPHHLLGCGVPQEFMYYTNQSWIYSVDTSNPVVHGLLNIRYGDMGLRDKASQKLFTMISAVPSLKQKEDIFYNINMFRRFCNG